MLKQQEILDRVKCCRPEVSARPPVNAVRRESLWFCRDCCGSFRQSAKSLYEGLVKRCKCPPCEAKPWVKPADKIKMEYARMAFQKKSAKRLAEELDVSWSRIYVFWRGL